MSDTSDFRNGLVINHKNNLFKIVEFLASNTANRLVDIDYSEAMLPNTFTLKQNYPNPFNPSTNIDIEIGMADNIKLIIYDIRGREIITLNNKYINAGNHTFNWDGKDNRGQSVASGVYIYTLSSSTAIKSQKMLMIK